MRTEGCESQHRKKIGSKGRALPPGLQASMPLVHLREGETFAELGAGFAVSTSTAWRYVNENIDVLATRSPTLGAALAKAVREGLP